MADLSGFELISVKSSNRWSVTPGDLIFSKVRSDGKYRLNVYFSEEFSKEMRIRKGDKVEVLYNEKQQAYALRLGSNGRTVINCGKKMRITMDCIGYAAEYGRVCYNMRDIDTEDGIAIVARSYPCRVEADRKKVQA